jgi:hypothetical protein
MMRRIAILLVLALWVGGTGCAGTARRPDGTSIFSPRAWNEAPAPPQRTVAVATETKPTEAEPTAKAEGLAKYFPGLARAPVAPPKTVSRYRPTWFGLRPNKETQVYTTDARAGLNQKVGPEPTTLPVALQVPTERRTADGAVAPTAAEAAGPRKPSSRVSDIGVLATTGNDPESAVKQTDFGGTPSKPGEDEINPLPPAAEPGSAAALANKMPELPAVDPLQQVKVAGPEPAATVTGPKSDPLAAIAPETRDSAPANPPSNPIPASGLPEPTFPASYTTQSTQPAPVQNPAAPQASVQASAAPAQAPSPGKTKFCEAMKSWVRSHHVLASPQSEPVSCVTASPQSDVCPACGHHEWKRPCLRRLVRKSFNLGEFADPPTAAPH